MTHEELVEKLKSEAAEIGSLDKEEKELLSMIVDALETRIPKKPIERFMLSYDIDAGVCPLCSVGVNEEMNFCSYCGQALDWEVSE